VEAERAAFEVNTAHTAAVIAAVPPEFWDRPPGGSAATLRAQLLHLALVRESICHTLTGEDTASLGPRFEPEAWRDPLAAFQAHAERCRALLARVSDNLDAPFTTRFGNRSTPRNYLRCMLVEEVHHRAQMTCVLRLFALEPPPFPGQAWVELNIDQGEPTH
jgi:uncharacterized damage-inducible protein DinB